MRPITRFIALVAAPAALGLALIWGAAARSVESEREAGLRQLADAAAVFFQQDLTRATQILSGIAAPWPEAAADDPLVAQATAGDTLNALRPGNGAILIGVLLPAPDSVAANVMLAEGRLRSAVIERFRDLTGVSTAAYLNGQWTAGDSLAPGALQATWLEEAGRGERSAIEFGHRTGLLTPASPNGNPVGAAILLLSNEGTPGNALAMALVGILLLTAVAATVIGLGPGVDARPSTRLAGTGLTLLGLVWIGAAGWMLSQAQESTRQAGVRSLTRVAALLRDYDAAGDLTLAAAVSGSRALGLDGDGTPTTSDGSTAPVGAEDLPLPPPGFPATGRMAATNELYLVIRHEGGRTVLFHPAHSPRGATLLAVLFGILTAFGLLGFLRADPFQAQSEPPESAPETP